MRTEFEVKILDIDVERVISKLDALGAIKRGEKMQKRLVYDFHPRNGHKWVRLRNDGTKTTLAIKEIQSDKIDGTKELEVSVGDFDTMNLILEKLGYAPKGYQENKRVSYELDGVEIEIDFWPRIPPYLEVEGKSAADVERVVRLLGFEISQTTSVNTTDVYKKHGLDIHAIKELRFERG
jgi:adenylate cyclase class 2